MSSAAKSAQVVAEALEALSAQLHLATQLLDSAAAATTGGATLQEDPDFIPPDVPAQLTAAELDSLRQRELGAYNDIMYRFTEQRCAYDKVEARLEELVGYLDQENQRVDIPKHQITLQHDPQSDELKGLTDEQLEAERATLLQTIRKKNQILRDSAMRAADVRQQILAYTSATHNPTLSNLTEEVVRRHTTKSLTDQQE